MFKIGEKNNIIHAVSRRIDRKQMHIGNITNQEKNTTQVSDVLSVVKGSNRCMYIYVPV